MSRRRRPGHRGGRPSRGSARYQARPKLGNVVYEFHVDGRAQNRVRRMLEGAAAERAFLAEAQGRGRMVLIHSKQDLANIEMNGEGVECLA